MPLTQTHPSELWPALLIFGGLFTLARYLRHPQRHPAHIAFGVASIGLGLFCLLFTLNVAWPIIGRLRWADMAMFWPALPLILSLALLTQFALTAHNPPRNWLALVAGLTALLIGGLAFPITLGFFRAVELLNFWPIPLILLGVAVRVATHRPSEQPHR